jgi:cell division transport system permease protein
MGTFFYFIKETFRGFVQAKLMTFVSIVTIAITLFFLGCMVIGFINIRLWLGAMSRKANLVAYLEDDAYNDSAACEKLFEEIRGFSEVDSLYLVGKDEAWKEFEKQYGAEMLESVDQNPLPARVDITLKKSAVFSEAVKSLKDKLQEIKGIEGVNYSYALMEVLQRIRRMFWWVSIILVPVLLLALLSMISNTVKLTIYARKDLIVNMQYVGATDLFIKTPFIFEGILQGVIGSVISVIALYVLKLFLYRFSLFWGEWYLPAALFSTGVLFGWIGSMNAVRRFLV